jgi:tRNA1Val (adenine37-N6)-methyltransferase
MLNKNGIIGLVFPFDQFDELKNLIDKIPLYINRICLVKGNRNRPVKRLLIELSKQKKEVKEEELIIEQKRHQYTDEYISLCKDFYLHF